MELIELQTRLVIATEAMAESARRIAVALEEWNKPYVPTPEEREATKLELQKMREEFDRQEQRTSEALLKVVKAQCSILDLNFHRRSDKNG